MFFQKKLVEFLRDNSGATALEYAMMAMLIGLSGVLSFRVAGGNLEQFYLLIQKTMAKMIG